MNRRTPSPEWTTEPFGTGPRWRETPHGAEIRDLPPVKVKEHRRRDGRDQFRVRLLGVGEAVPDTASAMPDSALLHDWQEVV